MWPWVFRGAQTYSPYVIFPFAFVIGAIGYNLETLLSDRETPANQEAVLERRRQRQSAQGNQDDFKVPNTIFDRFKKPDT